MKLTYSVRRLLPGLILVIAPLLSACQATMSLEEAKQVTASFVGSSFVPPPRTINDITAILDQQKLANPGRAAAARMLADQSPPATTDPSALATFYNRRGRAAGIIGRAHQEVEDLTKAASYAASLPGGIVTLEEDPVLGGHPPGDVRLATLELDILRSLALAEIRSGNLYRGLEHTRQFLEKVPSGLLRGWLIAYNSELAVNLALFGDLEAAEEALRECLAVFNESFRWHHQEPVWVARWNKYAAEAQATVAAVKGQVADAERFYRDAIRASMSHPVTAQYTVWLNDLAAALARVLTTQGRLLEAEIEARQALLGALKVSGRYSSHTVSILGALIEVLLAQDRYVEAATLARAAIEIHDKIGTDPSSALVARARRSLAVALVAQGRWEEALAEYEAIRIGMAAEPRSYERFLASYEGLAGQVEWALALLRTGRVDQALKLLAPALERTTVRVGPQHRETAEIRALLAMAHAARGDRLRALREFASAAPSLLVRSPEAEEESASRPARDLRLNLILASYMSLLADIRGTALEKEANIDAAAEAFRLADVARGRSVQRALDAGAARAAATTPALADLVRREQDAKKQLSALLGVLANVLSAPTDQQNPKNIASLRIQIETLRRAQRALAEQIEKEFPAYAQLINPAPATLEQARASLRPGEALIATYVGKERTFIWAIPQSGPVAFAAAPIGEQALAETVSTLRKALDPNAQTLGDIPEFNLTTAHRLYAALLEPVAPGWEKAESLLVVPHGPLGHLPFAVLPTRPTTLAVESGALLSKYRAVPWLARTHAVTMLPSVGALSTLRALPTGDPKRRPFVGFGDPYFSPEQASRAARAREAVEVASVATRGVPIKLRSSPKTQTFDSSQLAMLPRLPETADEIRSIALAMNADLTKEVFIGAQANERAVKSLDLSGYRVIAFATHGLVPGDLDGLTQPALALSSPEVAKVEGDGLLTMEEILGLRLNADWVVLSACNTASGNGAGAEAVSGLGRAFFYAGARALLVSNWPVETNSARELTTDLFRRQSANPRLTRAKALQQTMNAMMDGPGFIDTRTKTVVFSYAHPIFWAPFALVGDGG